MEDASERKLIQLEPFAHQVGGHSSMLCLDGATVAKPLVTREQLFYETLPTPLRPFVPSFHGALEVHVLQGEGGYVTHAATPPPLYRPHVGLQTRRSRIRLHDSGDIEIEGENEGMVFEDEDEEREQVASKSNDEDFSKLEEEEIHRITRAPRPSVGHALNPWVLRCHRESLSGLTPGTIQNFILLENLTARFKQPCVLDLKVGTRQYGDSASPAKVRSKMMKVATTTSGKLGLRLGGMQVYQVTTRRFLCRNKLFGRALTIEGFRMALVQFLHNGWYIRLDVVRPLLERLEALEGILTRLGAARFYTCSLLCLYEGELRTPSTTPLSPSTPAPPITPGPFTSMPPGSFSSTSSRFTFPTPPQSNAEAHPSVLNLVSKSVGNVLNGGERLVLDAKSSSLPTCESKTFPKPSSYASNIVSVSPESQSNKQVPETSLMKVVSSEEISSSTVQPHTDFRILRTFSHQNSIPSDSTKISTAENSDEFSSADKASRSTLEASFVTQEKSSQQASVSHAFITSTGSATSLYTSLQCKPLKLMPTENGISPKNIKLHISHREKQYYNPSLPSSSIPLHIDETQTLDDTNSCQNHKIVQESCISHTSQELTKKTEVVPITEERVIKYEKKPSRQSKYTLGRSVSADSASYVRIAATLSKAESKPSVASMIKKINSSETKVNGYVKVSKKERVYENGGKGCIKRSHSLEPQISFHSLNKNQNPFIEDGILSCYTSVSPSPLVDVRLIDFAHSTHRGLADPVTYAGPDQGFLFGLHNLINLLRDIAQEATTAMERC